MQLGTRTRTYDTHLRGRPFRRRGVRPARGRRSRRGRRRSSASVPLASAADVDRAVAAARRRVRRRRVAAHGRPPSARPRCAGSPTASTGAADELAELGVEENGYPIAFSEGYMAVMPSINLRTYADLCETYPFEEERLSPAARSLVLREPVGVVVAIPPFNGPLTLGTQKAAPALAAGCTVILKAPVQNGLACYVFAEAVEEAGLPPGSSTSSSPTCRRASSSSPTRASTRSASPAAPRSASASPSSAGATSAVSRSSSAASPRRSCSTTSTSRTAVPGIVGCSVAMLQGEICTAQSRILAPALALRRDRRRVRRQQIAALPVGDPADRDMVIGPMITRAHRDRVESYIRHRRRGGRDA